MSIREMTIEGMTGRRRRWPPAGRREVVLAAEPSLVNDIMALGSAERGLPRHRRAPERFWQRGQREA